MLRLSSCAGLAFGEEAKRGDLEAELCQLRAAVDSSQRGLSQLEAKVANQLETSCRRQVEDVLASQGPTLEFRQGMTKLQSESRRLATELSRLPTARDVQGALQRHQESLEERMGERIAALEHSLGHQHQAALERLEGRGSETWRGCLQRMATMEEKVVLQTDVVRIVDRVLGEVRKAGPELFGAGAVTGPAALNEMRKEMRRLEAKVAGLEARVLGIAEDSTAEGRIWRASICAKVETLERAVQDHSGRLAGDETLRREVLESCGQSCEAAEAAATRAQALAAKASQGAREAAAEVVASAEEALLEKLKLQAEEGRHGAALLEQQLKDIGHRLSLQESDLKRSKERASQAEQDVSQLSNRVATMRVDVSSQKELNQTHEEKILEREAADLELGRSLRDLRQELQVQAESLRSALEEHKKQVARVAVAQGEPAYFAANPAGAAGAVRQFAPATRPPQSPSPSVPAMEAQRPKALSPTPSEIPATKAVSPVVSETQAVSPVSSETLKAVAPVSQPAKASPVTEVPKAVSPVASETVPKAVSPVASHVPKAVSPVASETVPKSVSPVASQTLPKAVSPVASETVPKAVSPVASETVPKAVSPVASETVPKAVSPVASETVPKLVSPVASQTLPKAVSPASPVPVLKGPPGPPQVLNFRCPNFQKDCDGTYDLLPGKEANGRPVWKKRGGDRWMYLTIDKNWGVGGKSEFDKDFNCKNSYVFHPRTLGAPSPELLPKGWQLFDGQAWREDADVQATAEGSATGGQVPPQQKAPPAQPPQPTALQGLAGLSSGTPSARSHQTPAAPSSSRTQVDGAALADSILGARARATDGDNSWDEGDEPDEPQAPRGVAPPASVAPPVAPPAAPPVAPTAAQDQRASARAMADMGFDSESGSNAAEAFPRERPSDRAAMADLGFDSEQPSPVQHDARGRAESSDWDD